MNSLLANGAFAIPPFRSTAVSIKTAYRTVTKDNLKSGRYYPPEVWPGPPSPAKAFDHNQWPGVVWIDIKGGGSGKGDVDMNYNKATGDGSTRTDATTYPLSRVINFKSTNAGGNEEYKLLVGMHITSKEITRWTWQTYWWTPAPDVAVLPSSNDVVAARPVQLVGAPRNYAMAIGYSTETPSQPNVGGSNVGESVYVYNPWLEAGFEPSDLPDSKPGYSPDGNLVGNNYGVQTNCMSCHLGATYDRNGADTVSRFYTGDKYIGMDDPRFRGLLTVDLLWSIQGYAE